MHLAEKICISVEVIKILCKRLYNIYWELKFKVKTYNWRESRKDSIAPNCILFEDFVLRRYRNFSKFSLLGQRWRCPSFFELLQIYLFLLIVRKYLLCFQNHMGYRRVQQNQSIYKKTFKMLKNCKIQYFLN